LRAISKTHAFVVERLKPTVSAKQYAKSVDTYGQRIKMERLIQEPDTAPPPVFYEKVETPWFINPDKEMPIPIRTCKFCGYRDFADKFQFHNCRRPQ